jgi:glycosyltransferase involved in cell wall biosynthesis
MISVIFTCKGRPALTELCLRRLVEVMPHPYELWICYDGKDDEYKDMLKNVALDKDSGIIDNKWGSPSRFSLINTALSLSSGDLFMHVENDFYWVDAMCLDAALNAFWFTEKPLDYIRFEHFPFTYKNFVCYEKYDGKDICWMKRDSPYRFTFNPHIRKFKFPTDEPFMDRGFTKQAEQHHNDGYKYQSACMTGDNWRHLGIFSEGGHMKEYYGERFFNVKNKVAQYPEEYVVEFMRLTKNQKYIELFKRYFYDNWNKHSS